MRFDTLTKICAQALLSMGLLLSSQVAMAEDAAEATSPFSLDLSTGFFTSYMFRGQKLYDGTSIQPSVTASYDAEDLGSISGNLWMHIPGDSDNTKPEFTELDASVYYSNTFGPATFTVGNYWYTFSHRHNIAVENTKEVFGSVSFDTLLSPTVSVYHDYDKIDYTYYELGLSHEIKGCLGEGFNATPFAAFGFASESEKVYENDGLEQVTVGSSFDLTLGDITVVPTINYSFKVDDLTINQLWVGTTFSFSL